MIASPRGAALAKGRVAAGDFYELRLRQIYDAASGIDHITNEDARVTAVASATGIPESALRELVDDRPCHADTSGGLARRVKDASARREALRLCALAYNAIGSGASLSDVANEIHNLERLVAS
jgi:replicative DNA helicase